VRGGPTGHAHTIRKGRIAASRDASQLHGAGCSTLARLLPDGGSRATQTTQAIDHYLAREAAWDGIRQELQQFEGPGGFAIPAELLVGVAEK
jgi:hypothetical protein